MVKVIDVKPTLAWACVRHSCDGYNYIDISSMGVIQESAAAQGRITDQQCGPSWVKDNDVVGVVQVEIKPIGNRG